MSRSHRHLPPDDNFISRLLIDAFAEDNCFSVLPVDLHRELELARIVGRGRLVRHCVNSGLTAATLYLVRDVEHVGDQVHAEALAEVDALRDAQIVEDGPRSDPGIAAEVAVELQQRWSTFR